MTREGLLKKISSMMDVALEQILDEVAEDMERLDIEPRIGANLLLFTKSTAPATAAVSVPEAGAGDGAFLRKMRIVPDLEVR